MNKTQLQQRSREQSFNTHTKPLMNSASLHLKDAKQEIKRKKAGGWRLEADWEMPYCLSHNVDGSAAGMAPLLSSNKARESLYSYQTESTWRKEGAIYVLDETSVLTSAAALIHFHSLSAVQEQQCNANERCAVTTCSTSDSTHNKTQNLTHWNKWINKSTNYQTWAVKRSSLNCIYEGIL